LHAQIRLDSQPWTATKIRKRVGKHAIWLVIAVLTGGAWVFYFADAPTLLHRLVTFDAPFVAYASIALLTATTYVLGGLMREQVCIYMCPWPRIQGAMLDQNSLTVTYNDWRGEPRGKHRKRAAAEGTVLGDCIDCNACVNVCPTGVDIRDGQQIGCITCGLCIDACNSMMEKVDLPKHLISYSTLADYEESMAGAPQRSVMKAILKPRTFVYAAIWGGIGLAMIAALVVRDRLNASFEHVRNPPYVQLSDGSIRNGFSLKLSNMRLEPRMFEVSLQGLPDARMTQGNSANAPARSLRIQIPANKTSESQIFVTLPRTALDDEAAFSFKVEDVFGTDVVTYDASFFKPE
jgi:cytochrome c oxidase accessory protein FixG